MDTRHSGKALFHSEELAKQNGSVLRSSRAWYVMALIPLVVAGILGITGGIVLRPMPEALAALASGDGVEVVTEPWLAFRPVDAQPTVGLIFYPGARADARAYAPIAKAIAGEGYHVVVVPMPLNIAILNQGAAGGVMKAYPDIEHWVVGGHSLGGAMAASFARSHPDGVDGLAVWAPYYWLGYPDLSGCDMEVVTVYGTSDGLIPPARIEASRPYLPADARWIAIEGGNHAQFSWYGGQTSDNPATITREVQQQEAISATLRLLAAME